MFGVIRVVDVYIASSSRLYKYGIYHYCKYGCKEMTGVVKNKIK